MPIRVHSWLAGNSQTYIRETAIRQIKCLFFFLWEKNSLGYKQVELFLFPGAL